MSDRKPDRVVNSFAIQPLCVGCKYVRRLKIAGGYGWLCQFGALSVIDSEISCEHYGVTQPHLSPEREREERASAEAHKLREKAEAIVASGKIDLPKIKDPKLQQAVKTILEERLREGEISGFSELRLTESVTEQ